MDAFLRAYVDVLFNSVRVYSEGGGRLRGNSNFFDPKVTFGNRVLSMFRVL